MKKLSELCKRIKITDTNVSEEKEIKGLAVNSKEVKTGYVFFVTEGNSAYVKEAINNGAAVIIAESMYYQYPCLKVEDVRKSMALISSDYYDNPDKKLRIIGVVGTNGKTSITHILDHIFSSTKKTAVIGTLGIFICGKLYDSGLTTPDPPKLYQALYEAANSGVDYVFCEISAHAIYFDKFYGIRTEITIFTNITQDHLDFFGDMDAYTNTKLKYFVKENMKIGVINADDLNGQKILKNKELCSISYGIKYPSDIFAIDVMQNNRLDFVVNAFDDILYVSTALLGKFNVYNILAAITVARLSGIDCRHLEKLIYKLKPVEGRLNVINDYPKIIVDYAHTPDGLEKSLSAAKEFCQGKLIAVFGCGGNRDKLKRPIMAKIGTDIADICVLTEDNPRDEDAMLILNDMVEGIKDKNNYIVVPDRQNAIEFAINAANKKDCVIICGKGGENYIEVRGERLPYSDKETCLKALGRRHCRV